MSGAKRRGVSLPETLVTATLLLVISGFFLQTFQPIVKRQDWFADKQVHVENALTARERLRSMFAGTLLLANAELSPHPPGSQILAEFFRPREVSTGDLGELPEVDLREVRIYPRDFRYRLVLTDAGHLVETDQNDSYRRLVWSIGPGAQASASTSADLLQIDLRVSGLSEVGTPRQSSWTENFVFFP